MKWNTNAHLIFFLLIYQNELTFLELKVQKNCSFIRFTHSPTERRNKPMKKNNKNALPIVAVFAIVALLGVTLVAAYPFGSNGISNEDRDAMKAAIENKDYAAWKSLMESQITEERFNQIVEQNAKMQENMAQIKAAMDSGDYAAWKAAVAADGRNPKITQVITEDNFATFVKMQEARQTGDIETAKALAKELGLNVGMGQHRGRGFGKGMMQDSS